MTGDPPVDPRLVAWEKRTEPLIILAAIVPIAIALTPRGKTDPFVVVDLASWLVFLADLVVHIRYRHRYLRSGIGKFDLAIVVLTFPWYLIPGLQRGAILGLARLGRLARLVLAGTTTGIVRRVVRRIGRAGLYSLGLILVCSEVVYRVEPAGAGFTTRGDAIWWGFVTFTTVGYGDLVPVGGTGRVVAVLLMVGGIALIGLLAGSLAELLTESNEDAEVEAGATSTQQALLDEIRAVRAELAELRAELSGPPPSTSTPTDDPR